MPIKGRLTAEMWVDMQEKKTVDVIIPASYPDEKLQKILDRLEKQTHPVERIIVINTDEAGFPKNLRWPANMEVYHIAPEEFDHGATRDMAARKSTADLMLFMTQDAVPADTHLVEYLAKAFDDPLVAAAYARQLAKKTDSAIERFTRNFNYPAESRVKTQADIQALGIKTYFCSNSCAMYRKSTYEELGGFLPEAIFNEDMVFASTAINAGYSVAYVAEARVIHSIMLDFSSFKEISIMVFHMQIIRRHFTMWKHLARANALCLTRHAIWFVIMSLHSCFALYIFQAARLWATSLEKNIISCQKS